MLEATNAATSIFKELGALAFLIVVGALAFVYLVWRIVLAQDRITATQDKMLEKLSSHDQRAEDMHVTCKEHGTQIDALTRDVGELKTDVAELKGKVS